MKDIPNCHLFNILWCGAFFRKAVGMLISDDIFKNKSIQVDQKSLKGDLSIFLMTFKI